MQAVTITFLLIGGLGIAVLAASLFLGDVAHLGHPDADGPFSVPSVSAFVGAFGFGGAVAAAITGGNSAAAVVAAAVSGLVIAGPAAWLVQRMAQAAARMRTDSTPTRTDLLGRLGVVVTPIPARGYGEVRIHLGGQPVKLSARADSPVALGAHVFVVEAPSDTSVVVEPTG